MYIDSEENPQPQCLICEKVLSHSCMKQAFRNKAGHFETL